MRIVVDYREKALLAAFQLHHETVNVESKNLEVADILIENDAGSKILIERKTLKDLSASIRDGRYREQAERLTKSCDGRERVFYLIEGSTGSYSKANSKYTLPMGTLVSAMFTLSTEFRFSLYRTNDVRESADWISCIASKFNKGSAGTSQPCQRHLVKKSDAITKDNVACIMIAQIPGISIKSASQIIEQAGGLQQLLTIIKESPETLHGFTVKTSNGKERRFSKNCIENLKSLLG